MLLALLLAAQLSLPDGTPSLPEGHWRAWLDSPGGELPFGLEMRGTPGDWESWLINGEERIAIPTTSWDHATDEMVFSIPHYDSELRASISLDGGRLDGTWRKRRGLERWVEMPFHALARDQHRFRPMPALPGEYRDHEDDGTSNFSGRWAVRFAESEDVAVGIFEELEDHQLRGTFLTTLGDYRYLAGRHSGPLLELSCFDGAHAFLFKARLTPDLQLDGHFWSSDTWHETWTATPDPTITLPDSFDEVHWDPDFDLSTLRYPDADGQLRSLADPSLQGKVRVLSVFGSWCPNCNDEAALWSELHARYADRGLQIVGLAFELTGDKERDLKQVQRFRDRHDLKYPILLAGVADKNKAQAAFPVVDRVKSFPTAIFLDHEGEAHAVHSGFAGPATGKAHQRLRDAYIDHIEGLLAAAEAASE
ncbi:MAG: peroxiredoxin family protein [Planctomycetota bacterium]|jgi:thiol-disulfide isomerase/thioredoxin